MRGNWTEQSEYKYKSFLPLPYIDASMINIGEDFFDIIISKMLKLLYTSDSSSCRYCDYDNTCINKIEELRAEIATVYNYYSSLKYENVMESIPSYNIIEKIMHKHDVRSDFINLIEKFNDVMGKLHHKDNKSYDYMVICLDDIDMARTGHVQIMQLIYQYFMIPRVIVMVTFNNVYLTSIIEIEFYDNVVFSHKINDEKDRNIDISKNQAYDFLKKMMPSDMKITMPSWNKYDLRDLFSIRVILPGYSEFSKFSRLTKNFVDALESANKIRKEKNEELKPKEVIMLLLADRTHCYLDSEGYKLHFMEPDSLRNFYDIFYLLYEMKPLKEDSDYSSLEYNRKLLLNYLFFRMIPDYNLPYSIEQQIEKIETDITDRRGRRVWENYYQYFFEKKSDIERLYKKEDFVNREEKRYSIKNYNFGEMFRSLYFGSRLNLFDKNYVKAVLASYAFTMP